MHLLKGKWLDESGDQNTLEVSQSLKNAARINRTEAAFFELASYYDRLLQVIMYKLQNTIAYF